jgi:hypothetical protein
MPSAVQPKTPNNEAKKYIYIYIYIQIYIHELEQHQRNHHHHHQQQQLKQQRLQELHNIHTITKNMIGIWRQLKNWAEVINASEATSQRIA